jgi:hypothetical protein
MKKEYLQFVAGVIIALGFLFGGNVRAAEFTIKTDSPALNVGDEIRIDFVLNADGEAINAVEGVAMFTSEKLELKQLSEADSTINFWIGKPAQKDNKIIFSGIIPGGYAVAGGKLFSAIFTAKKAGPAGVVFQSAQALLNDGNGTPAQVSLGSVYVNVGERVSQKSKNIEQEILSDDIDKPEIFTPEVGRTPELFNGKWFVAFSAQDKGSGIDHYEVLEMPQFGAINSPVDGATWYITDSPYVLKDQAAKSDIYVKAVDKAGNARLIFVPAKRKLALYENYVFWGIIVLLIVVSWCIRPRFNKGKR